VAKQIKICLVIPSLNAGGMERVMSELANYFNRNNELETSLILLGKADKFYQIPDRVKIFEPDFIFNNKYRLYNTLKTINFLRQRVKEIKPDAVLSFGEMYNSFVLLATLFLGVRVFVSDRSRPDKKWGRLHELLRKLLYPKAKGIISQTNFSKNFLISETNYKNIHVIPNPVRPFKAIQCDKQNIILNVGRLIYTKRIDLLLNIFSKITNDDWELWIVGDGPQRKNLEDLTKEMGLDQKVVFWGTQKNIDQFYAKAEIFAFTSVSEGFPNALLEAMAAGLPVISFDCIAGPSDLITDNINGYLIPELDLSAYQDKLEILIKNEELRISFSENAISESKKYFIEHIGNEYLKFLLS